MAIWTCYFPSSNVWPTLLCIRAAECLCGTDAHLWSSGGRPGQSLKPRREIYGLYGAINSLAHTSSYLKGQPFRPPGVVNLAPWLFDNPDTRITIPHPSLTLKSLIPCYTKQKQPSPCKCSKKSRDEKKYFRKYFVKEPTACSDFAVLWWIEAAAAQLHASSQWLSVAADAFKHCSLAAIS